MRGGRTSVIIAHTSIVFFGQITYRIAGTLTPEMKRTSASRFPAHAQWNFCADLKRFSKKQ